MDDFRPIIFCDYRRPDLKDEDVSLRKYSFCHTGSEISVFVPGVFCLNTGLKRLKGFKQGQATEENSRES